MSWRANRAVPALLLALVVAGCARDTPREASPDVVLVVLDALRPDRLGVYGNDHGLTPFLDEWADHSYVFRRAYSAASYTTASVASLFTSRLLADHGVEWFNSILPNEALTLTEVLHAQRYATAAFTASLFFTGFEQGFDVVNAVPAGAKNRPPHADEVGAAARKYLVDRDRQRPVFLYLHLVESHVPWELPTPDHRPPYRRGQAPDPARVLTNYLGATQRPLTADELAEVQDAYDSAIVVMDERLRALFAELRELGVLDRAIVVIIADHGDDLGEHGSVGHALTLWETTIRVPLLVSLPGQSRRIDVDRVVSLLDVAPTVLDLLHEPVPSSFEGHSMMAPPGWHLATLWRRLRGGWQEQEGVAFSQLNVPSIMPLPPRHRAAVVEGAHKLLVAADGSRAYYDLAADPAEMAPDALGPADRARLDELLAGSQRQLTDGSRRVDHLDERSRERLKALGYVSD